MILGLLSRGRSVCEWEVLDSLGVCCVVVTVCHGVFGALGYVDVFVSGGLGVVEWTQHCVGDKEVLVSVYE